ncbi:hypothetical protein K1719_043191 [Acacia pycnantha]|nr:hypothetical protein K1719_043191 [Acacia pycnantha]
MKKTMRKTTTTTTTWDNYSEKFGNSGIREGIIVRRVIPSDNSCLFNAIGYVMDHDKTKASELRQPNADYCAWILDPEKWGGAIELSILAIIMDLKLEHMISKRHDVMCMVRTESILKGSC